MGKWSLFFLNPRATGEFGSTCGRLISLFRTALPTLAWGRGLEKVPQTNACPSSCCGWRTHPHSSRTTMQKGKHKRIILGAWNVRTLLNRAINSRPERGTAHVVRELQCYWVDIAALSETRIADEGSLREEGGDYTFFQKGKPQAEDRIHGVGFAIRTALLRSMTVLSVGINKRLMKLHIPLSRIRYLIIISAYAPTLTSPDNAKEQFYEQFDQVIKSTPPSNKLVILGDFNARVGRDYSNWEGVLSRPGVGKINDNGLLLISKCAEHSLCITNTLFRMADKYKTTWMHSRSKHWHLIDFIIVGQRDIRDVRVTRAMRGTECWTDHRLVRAVLTLHIAPPHRNRPKTVSATYNVARLKDPSYRARETPRSCDHRRQHWEMDLFQRNSQWDCEGSPWSEDQNPWRLVRWECRKDQRSHTYQEQVLHRVAEWPVLSLQAREVKALQAKVQTDLRAM